MSGLETGCRAITGYEDKPLRKLTQLLRNTAPVDHFDAPYWPLQCKPGIAQ